MRKGVAIGIAVAAGYGPVAAGVSLYRTAREAAGDGYRNRRAVADLDGPRLAPLRAALPRRGVIGYVEDQSEDVPYSKFAVTQYALAPLVVMPHPEPPLVIGNFVRPDADPPPGGERPFVLLADFGGGVKWFRRTAAGDVPSLPLVPYRRPAGGGR